MPSQIFLPKKNVNDLNKALTDLQWLYEEICKAESVGTPGLEAKKQYCLDMQERIKQLKLAYAPNQF